MRLGSPPRPVREGAHSPTDGRPKGRTTGPSGHHRAAAQTPSRRNDARWTLPLVVFGSSATKSTRRGYL